MKQSNLIVIENIPLTETVMQMRLHGDTSAFTDPGQFMNIRLRETFLRRPISLCDLDSDTMTIVFKIVGKGTRELAEMRGGERLDVLTGLGNGYDLEPSGDRPLLIGGGVGVPPLYYAAKCLIRQGKTPQVILGFNTQSEIFYEEEFRALGIPVTVTTVDGSAGVKGFVTDALPDNYSYFYTCGPEPMLKAIYRSCVTDGQFSFEERMGCGFGACLVCTCKTVSGYKRICKDGPVLRREEILWEK